MRPGWLRAPKWSVRREERRMLSVKVEQSAQKKVRLQHTTQLIDASIN